MGAHVRAFFSESSWLTGKGLSNGTFCYRRLARRCLAYLFCLVLALLTTSVFAFPIESQYRASCAASGPGNPAKSALGSSPDAACSAIPDDGDPGNGNFIRRNFRGAPDGKACLVDLYYTSGQYSHWGAACTISQVTTCPQNSSPSGAGQCTCNSGYVEDLYNPGTCYPEDDGRCKNSYGWESNANGLMSNYGALRDYKGNIPDGENRCFEFFDNKPGGGRHGCFLEYNGFIRFERNGVAYSGGEFKVPGRNNGLACDPDDPNNKPPEENECPDGQVQGSINGQTICYKPSDDNVNREEGPTTTTEKETRDNGDGTRTEKTTTRTTTTRCTGNSCNTVTTITTNTQIINNSDNSVVSNTTTTGSDENQDSLGELCKKNPKLYICSGPGEGEKSSWGGSCSAGFQCKGDAIQCAMARDQHQRNCQAFEPQGTAEEGEYAAGKDKTGNQTGDNPNNEDINAATTLDTSDALGGGGSGLQDLTVTVVGKSVTLPFSQINPYLAILGNLLVAVSFLLAFRIVARG